MISDTIDQAAERFGVPVRVITRGGFWKGRRVTQAREWIVQNHPDVSHRRLAKELGYADHTAVLKMRARMVQI